MCDLTVYVGEIWQQLNEGRKSQGWCYKDNKGGRPFTGPSFFRLGGLVLTKCDGPSLMGEGINTLCKNSVSYL